MTALLILILAVVLLDLAVLIGWGADSRDGRDWQPRQRSWGRFPDSNPDRSSTEDTDTLGGWTSSSGPQRRPTSPPLAL